MADTTPDFSLAKLVAGVTGSFVSLSYVKGNYVERISMGIGGAALSYYATSPVSNWVGVPDTEGLVGFMIGLFGMAIMSKVYEVILMADAKQIAADVWERIRRKWSA